MAFSRNSFGYTREDLSFPKPTSESRLSSSAKRARIAITTMKTFVKKVATPQPPPPPPQSTFGVMHKATQTQLSSRSCRLLTAETATSVPGRPDTISARPDSVIARPGTSGTAMSIPGLCITHPTTKGKHHLTVHVVPDSPVGPSADDVNKNTTAEPKKNPNPFSPRFAHPTISVFLDSASDAGSRCSTPTSPVSWRTVESDVVITTRLNDTNRVNDVPLSPKSIFRKSEDSFANMAAKMDGVRPFAQRQRVLPIPDHPPQVPAVRKMSRFNVFDVAVDKPANKPVIKPILKPLPPPPAVERCHPTVLKPKINRQSVPPPPTTTSQPKAPRPWSCAPSSRSGTQPPLLPYIPYKPDFDPYRASAPSPAPCANAPEVVPQQKKPLIKRKPVAKPAPSPKPAPMSKPAPPTKSSSNFKMNDSGFPVHSRSTAAKFTAAPTYQSRTQDLVEKKFKRDEAVKLNRIADRQERAKQAHYAARDAGRKKYLDM